MRIVLILVGILLGVTFGSASRELFGALMGALAGYLVTEVIALRRRAESLEDELRQLLRRGEARPADRPDLRPAAEYFDAGAAGGTEQAHEGAAARRASGAGEPAPASASDSSPRGRRLPPAYAPSAAERAFSAGAGDPSGSTTPAGSATATGSRAAAGSAAPGWEATPGSAAAGSASASRAGAAVSSAAAGSAGASGAGSRPPPRIVVPPENPVIRAIREYFTGGNTLVRVGVVILFIGVAFLLRYIAEHTNIPIQLRLAGVAAGGVVLLALGWKLRRKRSGYALALQGGGIGILYLTVFASLRLFGVMSPAPAFLLLVLLSALSVSLAVLQNSLAFAVLSVGCGFLAPVLASTGQGNHVVLFSYYGVLNLAIVAIAWFKAWRPLNVVGFLFTFVIGTAWGVLRYRPELLSTTEPFLILFFLLYVAIAVLFSVRQKPELRGYVDGAIVFGVPVVAFGLQSALVRHIPFALAYSAAALSLMYLALAWLLFRSRRETQQLLVEAFMALGVVFLTLAVPLALDGRWSAATWALEGAGLVWIGCRQDRRLPRAFGALLQIASGIIFLSDADSRAADVPVLNSVYLGTVMIAAGSVFAARALRRVDDSLHELERAYAPVLFVWGLVWWLCGGVVELFQRLSDDAAWTCVLVLFGVTALICSELKRRFDLKGAQSASLLLLPAMILYAVLNAAVTIAGFDDMHPFASGGWISWPLAFAAFYLVCRRYDPAPGTGLAALLHVPAAWLLVILLTWEFAWEVDNAVAGGGSWPAIAWAIAPGVALFVLPKLRARLSWPVGAHQEAYVGIAGSGIAVALMAWSFITNVTMRGDPYPLPYVPLLNPLDLAQAFVFLVLVRYWLAIRSGGYSWFARLSWKPVAGVVAALAFVWLNAVLLRTLHYWAGVPFDFDVMLRSTLVQTAISIFWTVLALATMLVATRFGSRVVWITGASLLGVVVAKLFLIDLSSVTAIQRIVSFVVVGLLMLVVGYFSPLPPAREDRAHEGA